MAFSLIVELPDIKPDWEALNSNLEKYSDVGIECFPIAIEEIFSQNYLGISIIASKITEDTVIALRQVILYLLDNGFKIFELYSSSEFSKANMNSLIRTFFS